MGGGMNTYIGPYVECRTSEVEVDASMRCCTRDTCSQHEREVHSKDKKFCPQCGSPIGVVTYKVKEKNVNGHWLVEAIDEDLSMVSNDTFFSTRENDEGIDTWIANKTFCERRCWVDASCVTELTPEMAKMELEQFRTHFAKALGVFNEKYGVENVVVKWGLVFYWS